MGKKLSRQREGEKKRKLRSGREIWWDFFFHTLFGTHYRTYIHTYIHVFAKHRADRLSGPRSPPGWDARSRNPLRWPVISSLAPGQLQQAQHAKHAKRAKRCGDSVPRVPDGATVARRVPSC